MNGGHYTAFVNCQEHIETAAVQGTANTITDSSNSSNNETFVNNKSSSDAGVNSECPDEFMERLARQLQLDPDTSTSLLAQGLYGTCGDLSAVNSASYFSGTEFDSVMSNNGKWYLFDDEVVEEVPADSLSQNIVTGTVYSA